MPHSALDACSTGTLPGPFGDTYGLLADCFTTLTYTHCCVLCFEIISQCLGIGQITASRLYCFSASFLLQASIRTAALWNCLFRVSGDYEENVLFPWGLTQPFSPFILTDFFSPDVVHYMSSSISFIFYSRVLISFRKCMHYLAYCGVRIGQVWIILHCRKTSSLFRIIIKSASTESVSLQVGYNTQLPYATW